MVAALKDAFFAGYLQPGDPIVERQLAKQMNIGTPAVREALVTLQEQGFVRRVANTATYVTKFRSEEVGQLYLLRVELELLAFQWAKPRVTAGDLVELEKLVDRLVDAGERGDRRVFLERDQDFHRRCWELSGNRSLADTLNRLMTPLLIFVVLASNVPLTAAVGREHCSLVNALRSLHEPEFSSLIRATLGRFAVRWIASMARGDGAQPI